MLWTQRIIGAALGSSETLGMYLLLNDTNTLKDPFHVAGCIRKQQTVLGLATLKQMGLTCIKSNCVSSARPLLSAATKESSNSKKRAIADTRKRPQENKTHDDRTSERQSVRRLPTHNNNDLHSSAKCWRRTLLGSKTQTVGPPTRDSVHSTQGPFLLLGVYQQRRRRTLPTFG